MWETRQTNKTYMGPNGGGRFQDPLSPIRIVDIELAERIPALAYDGSRNRLLFMVRLHTEPIGLCAGSIGPDGLGPDAIAAVLWRRLGGAVATRFDAAGLKCPQHLTASGLQVDRVEWPFAISRRQALVSGPLVTVVICTRNRPVLLEMCLRRLAQQDYTRFDVVVVDNASDGDATRRVVELLGTELRCRYVREPRVGLSRARNTGILSASGDIIAFLDDDDEPDRYWLGGLIYGFARSENVGCVTGPVMPARLDTIAEQVFELMGGEHGGRGLSRRTFSASGPENPLFPLPPFGVGANMAFQRKVLEAINGFDVALGAGTPAAACEDTLALTLTLLLGHDIAYEPAALVWHHHRPELAALEKQLNGYSVGLTAFYAALLRRRPTELPALVKLGPSAVRYLIKNSAGSAELAAYVSRSHLRGLAVGPLAYWWGRRQACRHSSELDPDAAV